MAQTDLRAKLEALKKRKPQAAQPQQPPQPAEEQEHVQAPVQPSQESQAAPAQPAAPEPREEAREAAAPAVERVEVDEYTRRLLEKVRCPKLVITIWGEKGVGKTYTALSLPGRRLVVSWDRKSLPIAWQFYREELERGEIMVLEPLEFLGARTVEEMLQQSHVVLAKHNEMIMELGEKYKPDWIIVDGAEIMARFAEYALRGKLGVALFQGLEWRFWRERSAILDLIHELLLTNARAGVVYIVYPTWQERRVAGETVDRVQRPRWYDTIMWQTDVEVEVRRDERNDLYYARVRSTKYPDIVEDKEYEITGRKFFREMTHVSRIVECHKA